MIMGDLGAQIIKIENPAGELARQLPPHFIAADSLYYLSINRNKRSVAVDLKAPQGVQLVRDLIATADVVIENFRPGVLARLGFDSVQSAPGGSATHLVLDQRLRSGRSRA